jgi:negative regulator of PHO system
MEYNYVDILYKNQHSEIIKVNSLNVFYVFKIIKYHHGICNSAIKEINILKELKHPNIIQLYNWEYNLKKTLLILEYADMDLKCYLNNNVINQLMIKNIMTQLCLGLSYCHNQYIIHRDLKPQNILIQFRPDITVKIADFGLAVNHQLNKNLSTNVVSLWYRAPEIILNQDYDEKIDIWSLGCIYYELLTNKILFKGTEETQLHIILGKLFKIELPLENCEVINLMIKINPSMRIDIYNLRSLL